MILRHSYFCLIFYIAINFVKTEEEYCSINGNRAINKVSEKFLSISIDPAVILTGLNLTETSLRLAQHLSPAFIRIAGPSTQYVKYTEGEFSYDNQNATNVVVTPAIWFGVNEWLLLANLTPVFAINDIATTNGVWNPKETLPLFELSDKLNVSCYWQLGYDCSNKTEIQYKQDLNIFRHVLDAFPDRKSNWQIVGSDLNECTSKEHWESAKRTMEDLEPVVKSIMWEPVKEVGTQFPDKKDYAAKIMSLSSKPNTKIWTSAPKETKPTSFGSTILWAKQIGESAKLGYEVVFRQPRLHEIFVDTPAYWFSLLHKYIMGTVVLDIKKPIHATSNAYVFGHCTRNQNTYNRRGALTVMVVNNGTNMYSSLIRVANPHIKNIEIQSYILTAASEESTEIYLNGIKLTSELLKQRKINFPAKIRRAKTIKHIALEVTPKSIGFFILPGARIPVCIREEENINEIIEEINKDQEASGELEIELSQRGAFGSLKELTEDMEKELQNDEKYYKERKYNLPDKLLTSRWQKQSEDSDLFGKHGFEPFKTINNRPVEKKKKYNFDDSKYKSLLKEIETFKRKNLQSMKPESKFSNKHYSTELPKSEPTNSRNVELSSIEEIRPRWDDRRPEKKISNKHSSIELLKSKPSKSRNVQLSSIEEIRPRWDDKRPERKFGNRQSSIELLGSETPNSKNIDMNMERVFKDLARSKAAKKDMVFTSKELDELMSRANKKSRYSRGVNDQWEEWKAKTSPYSENHIEKHPEIGSRSNLIDLGRRPHNLRSKLHGSRYNEDLMEKIEDMRSRWDDKRQEIMNKIHGYRHRRSVVDKSEKLKVATEKHKKILEKLNEHEEKVKEHKRNVLSDKLHEIKSRLVDQREHIFSEIHRKRTRRSSSLNEKYKENLDKLNEFKEKHHEELKEKLLELRSRWDEKREDIVSKIHGNRKTRSLDLNEKYKENLEKLNEFKEKHSEELKEKLQELRSRWDEKRENIVSKVHGNRKTRSLDLNEKYKENLEKLNEFQEKHNEELKEKLQELRSRWDEKRENIVSKIHANRKTRSLDLNEKFKVNLEKLNEFKEKHNEELKEKLQELRSRWDEKRENIVSKINNRKARSLDDKHEKPLDKINKRKETYSEDLKEKVKSIRSRMGERRENIKNIINSHKIKRSTPDEMKDSEKIEQEGLDKNKLENIHLSVHQMEQNKIYEDKLEKLPTDFEKHKLQSTNSRSDFTDGHENEVTKDNKVNEELPDKNKLASSPLEQIEEKDKVNEEPSDKSILEKTKKDKKDFKKHNLKGIKSRNNRLSVFKKERDEDTDENKLGSSLADPIEQDGNINQESSNKNILKILPKEKKDFIKHKLKSLKFRKNNLDVDKAKLETQEKKSVSETKLENSSSAKIIDLLSESHENKLKILPKTDKNDFKTNNLKSIKSHDNHTSEHKKDIEKKIEEIKSRWNAHKEQKEKEILENIQKHNLKNSNPHNNHTDDHKKEDDKKTQEVGTRWSEHKEQNEREKEKRPKLKNSTSIHEKDLKKHNLKSIKTASHKGEFNKKIQDLRSRWHEPSEHPEKDKLEKANKKILTKHENDLKKHKKEIDKKVQEMKSRWDERREELLQKVHGKRSKRSIEDYRNKLSEFIETIKEKQEEILKSSFVEDLKSKWNEQKKSVMNSKPVDQLSSFYDGFKNKLEEAKKYIENNEYVVKLSDKFNQWRNGRKRRDINSKLQNFKHRFENTNRQQSSSVLRSKNPFLVRNRLKQSMKKHFGSNRRFRRNINLEMLDEKLGINHKHKRKLSDKSSEEFMSASDELPSVEDKHFTKYKTSLEHDEKPSKKTHLPITAPKSTYIHHHDKVRRKLKDFNDKEPPCTIEQFGNGLKLKNLKDKDAELWGSERSLEECLNYLKENKHEKTKKKNNFDIVNRLSDYIKDPKGMQKYADSIELSLEDDFSDFDEDSMRMKKKRETAKDTIANKLITEKDIKNYQKIMSKNLKELRSIIREENLKAKEVKHSRTAIEEENEKKKELRKEKIKEIREKLKTKKQEKAVVESRIKSASSEDQIDKFKEKLQLKQALRLRKRLERLQARQDKVAALKHSTENSDADFKHLTTKKNMTLEENGNTHKSLEGKDLTNLPNKNENILIDMNNKSLNPKETLMRKIPDISKVLVNDDSVNREFLKNLNDVLEKKAQAITEKNEELAEDTNDKNSDRDNISIEPTVLLEQKKTNISKDSVGDNTVNRDFFNDINIMNKKAQEIKQHSNKSSESQTLKAIQSLAKTSKESKEDNLATEKISSENTSTTFKSVTENTNFLKPTTENSTEFITTSTTLPSTTVKVKSSTNKTAKVTPLPFSKPTSESKILSKANEKGSEKNNSGKSNKVKRSVLLNNFKFGDYRPQTLDLFKKKEWTPSDIHSLNSRSNFIKNVGSERVYDDDIFRSYFRKPNKIMKSKRSIDENSMENSIDGTINAVDKDSSFEKPNIAKENYDYKPSSNTENILVITVKDDTKAKLSSDDDTMIYGKNTIKKEKNNKSNTYDHIQKIADNNEQMALTKFFGNISGLLRSIGKKFQTTMQSIFD